MVPVVATTLHHRFGGIPRQEHQRVHRFHIFGMFLFQNWLSLFGTCRCIVAKELHKVLVTIEFKDIELASIRRPRKVGHIIRLGLRILQPNCLAGKYIEDSNADILAFLACHRIFIYISSSDALGDINLRIAGDAALVFLVECQSLSVRTPEQAAADAKLITADAVTIDNVIVAVRGQLNAISICGLHKDIAAYAVSHIATLLIPHEF